MNMPVKAIKSILGKELDAHYEFACQKLYSQYARSYVHIGYRTVKQALEQAATYDDLQDVLQMADYRMSLQDWINSL